MSKSKAFTLVELLIATTIIVMMITIAASVDVNYFYLGTTAKHIQQANALAEDTFNQVRNVRDQHLMQDDTQNSLPPCSSYNVPVGCFPQPLVGGPAYTIAHDPANQNMPTGFLTGSDTFQPDGAGGTVYTRTIYFEPIAP